MEPTEENIRAWDAAHRARAEPVELPPIVQRTLGDLKKKRVLHLHCGTGEATAALAELGAVATGLDARPGADRKSTRLNSSHMSISYAVFCLKKKNHTNTISKVTHQL